jgi:hypothetical protein
VLTPRHIRTALLKIFAVSWYGKSAFVEFTILYPMLNSTDKIFCPIIFSENQNKIVVMLNVMVCFFVLGFLQIKCCIFVLFNVHAGITFFWLPLN